MDIEMKSVTTATISSSGLPVYRGQFINAETSEIISDVDIATSADCVRYINNNSLIKEGLGFKKGEKVDTDLEELVNRILYPYYPPEFVTIYNASSLPEYGNTIEKDTKTYVEKETVTQKFIMSPKVLAGSKPITKCSLVRYQNNMRDVIENKPLNILPGQEEIIDFNVPGFKNDITYFFEISDGENVVQSVKFSYEFILPIFVGYTDHGLLDPTLEFETLNNHINDLIKETDRVERRLVEINTEQKAFFDVVPDENKLCPFILVPLKWNSLVKIEDANGIDILKFFGENNNITLHISPSNTTQEGYVLYISKLPVDSENKNRYLREITYKFTHDMDWKDTKSDGEQTEVLTGFEVLTPGPIDSRFVKETYDDLAYIANPYEGLIVYVKNIKTYYKYNANGIWEVTNNMTRFYSGKPSDTMGGKFDISIDIATGNIYQKNNSNVWELKGNMRTGVTN